MHDLLQTWKADIDGKLKKYQNSVDTNKSSLEKQIAKQKIFSKQDNIDLMVLNYIRVQAYQSVHEKISLIFKNVAFIEKKNISDDIKAAIEYLSSFEKLEGDKTATNAMKKLKKYYTCSKTPVPVSNEVNLALQRKNFTPEEYVNVIVEISSQIHDQHYILLNHIANTAQYKQAAKDMLAQLQPPTPVYTPQPSIPPNQYPPQGFPQNIPPTPPQYPIQSQNMQGQDMHQFQNPFYNPNQQQFNIPPPQFNQQQPQQPQNMAAPQYSPPHSNPIFPNPQFSQSNTPSQMYPPNPNQPYIAPITPPSNPYYSQNNQSKHQPIQSRSSSSSRIQSPPPNVPPGQPQNSNSYPSAIPTGIPSMYQSNYMYQDQQSMSKNQFYIAPGNSQTNNQINEIPQVPVPTDTENMKPVKQESSTESEINETEKNTPHIPIFNHEKGPGTPQNPDQADIVMPFFNISPTFPDDVNL